ncbi:hypothetical protein [Sulfolobus spindle-shaped virus]|nr:hypothetical protein [Sulfolobus spindle-shaped virus]
MSFFVLDWDEIEAMLKERMRTWGTFDYFVIDDQTVLVKVYAEDDNRLMFTIKAKWTDAGLIPIEVS